MSAVNHQFRLAVRWRKHSHRPRGVSLDGLGKLAKSNAEQVARATADRRESRHCLTMINGCCAQTAVIPGRLRQGALKPFATRYPGKVLYLKCCTQSRACREREGGHFGRLDLVRVRGNEASAIKGGAALGRGHALRYCRNGSNLARRSRQALAGRCRGGPQDRVRRGAQGP